MKIYEWMKELGLNKDSFPENWGAENDERKPQWKKTRKKWGFDERDTWSLDYTLALYIYPRLKMFKENYYDDTNFSEILDDIIKAFEIIIKEEGVVLNKKLMKDVEKGLKLFTEYYLGLWY